MEPLRQLWDEHLPTLQNSVPFDLNEGTPLVFRVGSHSHGTYVPPESEHGVDDVDLMVIVVPPADYVLGMKKFEHTSYKHGKLDVVFYDWSKWLRMISKSNPNVVGTLWLESEDVIQNNRYFAPYWRLLSNRQALVSKRMYPAFVGYAKGQLYKMVNFAHEGYMGEKRKRLVAEYGYDVKNAAHLIRLMRMAVETLQTGIVAVRRPDAAELIEIKSGKWTKDRVIEEAGRLFGLADEALKTTTLPDDPDDVLIHNMMIKGYRDWWHW